MKSVMPRSLLFSPSHTSKAAGVPCVALLAFLIGGCIFLSAARGASSAVKLGPLSWRGRDPGRFFHALSFFQALLFFQALSSAGGEDSGLRQRASRARARGRFIWGGGRAEGGGGVWVQSSRSGGVAGLGAGMCGWRSVRGWCGRDWVIHYNVYITSFVPRPRKPWLHRSKLVVSFRVGGCTGLNALRLHAAPQGTEGNLAGIPVRDGKRCMYMHVHGGYPPAGPVIISLSSSSSSSSSSRQYSSMEG
jgi:hypothetical protein